MQSCMLQTIHGKSRFPGLFIWLTDGRRVPVRVPDGCLLLQAGKQLEWLTAGAVKAGMHEVRTLQSSTTPEAVPFTPNGQLRVGIKDRGLLSLIPCDPPAWIIGWGFMVLMLSSPVLFLRSSAARRQWRLSQSHKPRGAPYGEYPPLSLGMLRLTALWSPWGPTRSRPLLSAIQP